MRFPDQRKFAFSILDDTDVSTLENVRPVYECLRSLGMRTTKTVWPLDCPEGSRRYFAADTLQRRDYLTFVRELAADGFEIAFHGATMESSVRERTLLGLEFLQREFGGCPRLHANHGENLENLYWGAARFHSPIFRWLARAGLGSTSIPYSGEQEGSRYFWGDVCLERFKYVRNFAFRTLNALSVNPEMPYRLRSTPYVNYWFSTSDAPDVGAFRALVTREAIDRLAEEGGACIVSTHLGKGFACDGRLDPEVEGVLDYLARKPGWFVPVSTLLDHLLEVQTERELGARELFRLELRFICDRLASRLGSATAVWNRFGPRRYHAVR